MSTSNFFEKKQNWSKIKDKVVSEYLTPYCAKLLATHKPLKIVDCFAGKGKFDDGEEGSPIMIAKVIHEILKKQTSYSNKNIEACFIEQKYYTNLQENTKFFSNCRVISGNFEDNIASIIENNKNKNSNLFLYIDPYGIKSLSFDIFHSLKEMKNLSTEILMNFNSFGFLREGFRLLQKSMPPELKSANYEDDSKNTVAKMNKIANGNYWQQIVQDKNDNKITMYEAEEKFIQEYKKQLQSVYEHIIDIPIKVKREHIPKYRLIFGTNHHEGLFLMVDNMVKRWNEFLNMSNEEGLFKEFNLPNYNMGDINLENEILNFIPKGSQIKYLDLLKALINTYGISFSIREYTQTLSKLSGEDDESIGGLFANNQVKIVRNFKTPTGKESKSWNWNEEIYIERI